MDGMIKFNGTIGIFILLATMAILLLVAVVALVNSVSEAKSPNIEIRQGRSKHFLFSAILFLLFDGAFFLFLMRGTTFEVSKGAKFDGRMIFIWIPSHIIGYLSVVFILRLVELHKIRINQFLDKLR